MTIEEYDKAILYSENYLGIARGDDLMIIQITVNNTRGPEQKKTLFARRRSSRKELWHQAGTFW